MKQSVKLKCPVCQNPATAEIENSINTANQRFLKRELLEGRLHQFTCEECGAKRQIETTFLYHDPEQKFMLFLVPRLKDRRGEVNELIEKISEEHDVNFTHYELRLVKNHAELVEKIQLFDQKYNDREIEIVKLLTDGLLAKEKPDAKVKARYFIMRKDEPKIMYITEGEQLLVDFNQSLLDFAKDKYKKITSISEKGEFLEIDAQWAAQALSQ